MISSVRDDRSLAFKEDDHLDRFPPVLLGSRPGTVREPMNHEAQPLPVSPGGLSVPSGTESSGGAAPAGESACRSGEARHTGLLIVNADDWGREPETTGRILDCALRGAVSSVSAMVFMEDSERSAAMAREREIEAGLHLNFTTSFSAPGCPTRLVERQ